MGNVYPTEEEFHKRAKPFMNKLKERIPAHIDRYKNASVNDKEFALKLLYYDFNIVVDALRRERSDMPKYIVAGAEHNLLLKYIDVLSKFIKSANESNVFSTEKLNEIRNEVYNWPKVSPLIGMDVGQINPNTGETWYNTKEFFGAFRIVEEEIQEAAQKTGNFFKIFGYVLLGLISGGIIIGAGIGISKIYSNVKSDKKK